MFFTKNLKNARFKKKMFYKFTKFFEVKNVVELQTYYLCLFDQWKIYFIFHVSLLKSYYKNINNVLFAETILVKKVEKYKIKNILKNKKKWEKFYYFVRWKNFSFANVIEFFNIIWQICRICSSVDINVSFSLQCCLKQKRQDFEYEKSLFERKIKHKQCANNLSNKS